MSSEMKPYAKLNKKERQLVSTISKRNWTIAELSINLETAVGFIIKTARDEDQLWEYFDEIGGAWWHGESSELGVYSEIKPYINKSGHESDAHYTENDKYIGSVKKLGSVPVSYEGNFEVSRKRFNIDFNATKEQETLVFVPKSLRPRLAEAVRSSKKVGIIAARKARDSSSSGDDSEDTSL